MAGGNSRGPTLSVKAVFRGLAGGYGTGMSPPKNPIVVIPSRLAASRLPNKPIADIHGVPMIVHVWRRAMEADIGPVIVACADFEIIDAVKEAGGDAIYTNPAHASGSDRVFEALHTVDPLKKHDVVVNIQGDLPTLDAAVVQASLEPLANAGVDIATLAAEITLEAERDNPNVVKAVIAKADGANTGRALYFSRARVPSGDVPLYHHIGLYAFRREALETFVKLPPGNLERQEKLEQLRALENGMRIDVRLVDTVPLGVDTPADLERAREMLKP
ncbi:MAG: 3-deoxy-manno-octulosonate cytidylyltransferase [Rhodospirillales bacterium]|nr:3-deoxy-manno-octulosonate cytidylyltransferase [Rhodospirillales bacterium]